MPTAATVTKFPSRVKTTITTSITLKAADATDIHVGGRIRMRRMMLGVSQEKLGEALGITFQQIQKYEKGKNRVSASKLQAIAGILNIPVAWFFEGAPGATQVTAETPAIPGLMPENRQEMRLLIAFRKIGDADQKAKLVAMAEAMAK